MGVEWRQNQSDWTQKIQKRGRLVNRKGNSSQRDGRKINSTINFMRENIAGEDNDIDITREGTPTPQEKALKRHKNLKHRAGIRPTNNQATPSCAQ